MYIHVQVGGEEGRCGVEWVRILLHSHQPLLLELVRGGGGEGGGVRGEDVFLWPFLDLCLTSSGELDWERMTSSSWAKDETSISKAVMVGPDKPAIPGQHCFELISSHQQGIYTYM